MEQPSNARSIEDLLIEYLPTVRAYVRLNVGRDLREQESSSDMVQSVCRAVLAASCKVEYHDDRSFRNWLLTVVLSKIRARRRYWSSQRRDIRRQQPLDLGDGPIVDLYASTISPTQFAERSEMLAQIEHAFDRMPARYREVITMHLIAQMTHDEIAQNLGITNANPRILLSRALARLALLVTPGRPTK